MMPPRTVVVALDLSVGSEAALVRAATLAARTGAALHAVYVDGPAGGPAGAAEIALDRFVDGALGLAGTDGAGPGGTVPGESVPEEVRRAVVRESSVPSALFGVARSVRADLLVVGTHGRSGLNRLLVGSVTEACVAGAPCPVLTVPPGAEAREPSPAAPVLVAVDFADLSRTVLAAGRALAAIYGAPVELVHVVRDAGPYTGLVPSALTLAGIDDERDRAVRQRLARFAGAPAPAAVHAALGAPSRQIAALAASRGAGAVVMGTHGRGSIVHLLVGSTARATLQRTPCAVLTIRRAAPSARSRPAVSRAVTT